MNIRNANKTPLIKKRIGNIINMNTNAKVKERKGYEYWAAKHHIPMPHRVVWMGTSFAYRRNIAILTHLKRYGVSFAEVTIQTDSGTHADCNGTVCMYRCNCFLKTF